METAPTIPIIYDFVPSLGGYFYLRVNPSVIPNGRVGDDNFDFIMASLEYSVSASGPFTFLNYVPFGLPVVSGS